jgi:hypothetical protein
VVVGGIQLRQLGLDVAFEIEILNAHFCISWLVGLFAMTRTLS